MGRQALRKRTLGFWAGAPTVALDSDLLGACGTKRSQDLKRIAYPVVRTLSRTRPPSFEKVQPSCGCLGPFYAPYPSSGPSHGRGVNDRGKGLAATSGSTKNGDLQDVDADQHERSKPNHEETIDRHRRNGAEPEVDPARAWDPV